MQCNFPESAWPRQIELTTAALVHAGVSGIQLIHLLANSRYERTIIGRVAKPSIAAAAATGIPARGSIAAAGPEVPCATGLVVGVHAAACSKQPTVVANGGGVIIPGVAL